MNIDGANVLSLLSGGEVSGNLSQTLLAGDGAQTGFSEAFLQQLTALQANLSGQIGEAGQSPSAALSTADSQTVLQNFAALFGKGLPSANASTMTSNAAATSNSLPQDIDLNDTLKALADVLQHLQQLESSGEATVASAPPEPVLTTQKDLLSTESAADKAVIDEQQAALAASLLVQPVATPVMPPVVSQENGADALLGGTVEEDLSLASLPAASKKSFAGSSPVSKDGQLTNPSDTLGQETGLEFERSISAMLGQNDAAAEQTWKDAQSAGFKTADDMLAQLDSADVDRSAGADKMTSGMAADIAKLNQSLPAQVRADVPAMSKSMADPGWNKELSEKLLWMHKQAMPSAELRLNPEHLGPVLIKIDMHQDQATIAFTTQHQAVKEAIEAALPKLREMFNAQQLQLTDVNVSQHQSEQRQSSDFFQAASDQNRSRRAEAEESLDGASQESVDILDEIEAGRAIASNGLLSLFA